MTMQGALLTLALVVLWSIVLAAMLARPLPLLTRRATPAAPQTEIGDTMKPRPDTSGRRDLANAPLLDYLAAIRLWRNADKWRAECNGVFYAHNERRKRKRRHQQAQGSDV